MPAKSPWTEIKNKYKIYSTRKFNEIKNIYATPESFENVIANNPYEVFIQTLNKTFKQADELALEYFPNLKASAERCKWCCWDILKKNESEGDTCINANLLASLIKKNYSDVYSFIVDTVKNNPMFHYDAIKKNVSFMSTYNNELRIAEEIKNRVKFPVKMSMNWEKYVAVDGLDLTEEQMEVLKLACTESIIMLNGSAGTGKTSAMKALVEMVTHEGHGCTILAPTGIAAKRIAEVTGHEASTIHKFIANPHAAMQDFLIIDEMSMVGVNLLGLLLLKVPSSTKIILVCDEAQLVSISCGNIVQDIIDSKIVPMVKLTKVFRYGKGGIATVATDVRMGKNINENMSFNDYNFIKASNHPLEDIIMSYDSLRTKYNPEDIMILSPFNVRESGTFAINKAIQDKYNSENPTLISYKRQSTEIEFKVGDRIVNTENNYHMLGEYDDIAVMNGEQGVVTGFDGEMLSVEYECGKAYLEKGDVFKQLLGYSISVHKSQGSQSKAVIVIADKSHGFFLTRNLLYVALSRAQEKLILIGDIDTINEALKVEANKERETMLKEMLLK